MLVESEQNKKNTQERRIPGYAYHCSPMPLFELGSLHHDFYLLNLRLPDMRNNVSVNTNTGKLTDISVFVSKKNLLYPFYFLLSVFFSFLV